MPPKGLSASISDLLSAQLKQGLPVNVGWWAPEIRGSGYSALLGFVIVVKSYNYFSLSVSFSQIPDRLKNLIQPVTPVDDGRYLSRRQEVAHRGQVLLTEFRHKRDELLADKA